jgi:hypothetical protein
VTDFEVPKNFAAGSDRNFKNPNHTEAFDLLVASIAKFT